MKKLPVKCCWECSYYTADNLDDNGNYHGHCRHLEIGRELIREFINGRGLPEWCPLEDY